MSPESEIFLINCVQFASFTLLAYDHVLTLPSEIRVVWSRPMRKLGVWLFLINRYYGLALSISGNLFAVATDNLATFGEAQCRIFVAVRPVLLLPSALVVGCIFVTRTYALYYCSKRILAVLLSISAILLCIACWSLFALTKSDPPSGGPIFHGCHVATTATSAIHLAVPWQCLLAFDGIIVVLTLLGGRSTRSSAQRWRLSTSNLVTIIARDGTLYFATAALANLANIITLYTAPPLLRGVLTSPACVFSVMICSRLVLNLHESLDTERLPSAQGTDSALLDTDAEMTMPWAVDALQVPSLGAPLTTAGIHVRDAEEGRTRTGTQNALDNDPEMMQMTELRLREVTHP